MTSSSYEGELKMDLLGSGMASTGPARRDPFWPFAILVWVPTHTLCTTGLDQPTNRCVKLQQQAFLNFSAEPWW